MPSPSNFPLGRYLVATFATLVCNSAFAEIEMAAGLRLQPLADHSVVPDCTNVTVDPDGRILASGPGYIRMLTLAEDGHSIESVTPLTDRPSHGAHGMCFDDSGFYFVGDGGVWRMVDSDNDGVVDTTPTKVMEIKTGGEHDAHALRRDPDGYWYLIAGNNTAGMFDLQNVEAAAIPAPRAGAIWRISPDWSEREVWAHGFRNAFDFDFAPNSIEQAIVTFDSDGERDVSLPWYRPTRVYRVRKGDDAGWMSRSWKRPNVDAEMPTVMAELGRGSPTGVLRSRNHRLPKRFDNGVFVLDWTFGRIVFVSDDHRVEKVATATGNTGFAVTDLEALPDGRIVVSVGGRGSRGGLYLIDATSPRPGSATELEWPDEAPKAEPNPLRDFIVRLRQSANRELDLRAARLAVETIEQPQITRRQLIDATTLIIESIGGLGPAAPDDTRDDDQKAAVFDGYRSQLRPKLPRPLIDRASTALVRWMRRSSGDAEVQTELIRALAVLESDSVATFKAIAGQLQSVAHPTEKLHRLIALARLPVPRSDEMTEQIIDAMIEIPLAIQSLDAKIDRNWTPRLEELMTALHHRDVLMPGRLVAHDLFGHPTHLVWSGAMDPEELERTRIKLLRSGKDPPTNPQVARFIALGNDAVPRPVIQAWLEDPATRSAGWLAITRYPSESDAEQLIAAALSVDPVVRAAAERALEKIGVEKPERQPTAQSTARWLADADAILSVAGDAEQGQSVFVERKCAACHNGATALGPSLEGVARRFNPMDLWRSTVDPSHTIPDRYRAKQVLTDDGRVVIGMRIYESVDGITLLTAEGVTVRINADEIVESRDSTTSIMPEALLDGLTHQQAANLMAYLQSM